MKRILKIIGITLASIIALGFALFYYFKLGFYLYVFQIAIVDLIFVLLSALRL